MSGRVSWNDRGSGWNIECGSDRRRQHGRAVRLRGEDWGLPGETDGEMRERGIKKE